MQTFGVAGYAVGGGAMIVGGILVLLNHDESRVRTYDTGETQPPAPAPVSGLEISPLLIPGGSGISVAFRFQ